MVDSRTWSPNTLCMSIQAKGELRAARAEIDELKEDKAVLGKTLDIKGKEIRMQLLQVFAVRRKHGSSPLLQWHLCPIHELFVSCCLETVFLRSHDTFSN